MPSRRSNHSMLAPLLTAILVVAAAAATWPALAQQPSGLDMLLVSLMGAGIGVILWQLAGRQAHRPAVLLIYSVALGHLGFMLGLMADFGTAGLLVLAAWCTSQGDSGWIASGWNDLADMLRVAPLGHLGMLLGCNLGMLMAGCDRFYIGNARLPGPFVFLVCNLGMVMGMFVAVGLWPVDNGASLSTIGLLMAVQMSFGMLSGMLAALLAMLFMGTRTKQAIDLRA